MKTILFFIGSVTLFFSCNKKAEQKNAVVFIPYTVSRSLPHDTKAFTEGLEIHDDQLYESTGQENSWIGVVDVKTGVTDKKVVLGNEYFGEGITILNNKVYQLTYTTRKGFVYDLNTFRELRQFSYNTQGWGLTHDVQHLIMSDGSNRLYFIDTTSLSIVKTIAVRDASGPLHQLNELEYVNGFIYANIWQTSRIAKIDPITGEVKGIIDLSSLTSNLDITHPSADVLNGIAWHASTKTFLVTGKYWPFIYVLKIKGF